MMVHNTTSTIHICMQLICLFADHPKALCHPNDEPSRGDSTWCALKVQEECKALRRKLLLVVEWKPQRWRMTTRINKCYYRRWSSSDLPMYKSISLSIVQRSLNLRGSEWKQNGTHVIANFHLSIYLFQQNDHKLCRKSIKTKLYYLTIYFNYFHTIWSFSSFKTHLRRMFENTVFLGHFMRWATILSPLATHSTYRSLSLTYGNRPGFVQ